MTVEQVEKTQDDRPRSTRDPGEDHEGRRVGYVCEKGKAFPLGADINRFTLANGANPHDDLVDGTSDGEQCIDELLDRRRRGRGGGEHHPRPQLEPVRPGGPSG
jgi:hypothetical protein